MKKKQLSDLTEETFVDTISLLLAAYSIMNISEKAYKSLYHKKKLHLDPNKDAILKTIKEMIGSWAAVHPEKQSDEEGCVKMFEERYVKILDNLGYE